MIQRVGYNEKESGFFDNLLEMRGYFEYFIYI
jgi:hypothetical protein